MADLDLELDRATLRVATAKKPAKVPDPGLDETSAILKGLPQYGYVPVWKTPWDTFALYRITLTGKGKQGKYVAYYGRFKEAVIRPPKPQDMVLFRALCKKKTGEPPRGYPEFCDGEIHSFDAHEIFFTGVQLMRWYERTVKNHLLDLSFESNRLVSILADIGSQAQSIVAQQGKLREHFPYHLLHKIEKPVVVKKPARKKKPV